VRLEARTVEVGVEFLVTDSGPGLPLEVRQALFRPVRSTKRGGGGVGLAISYRLARHADGELALVRSDAQGSVFRLFVPAAGARVNDR
jgi:signal transduction histidine kinase